MRAIDEQYLRTPFYGSRKLAEVLSVNRKRVQRLMRVMGIEAIYPKRRTTWPGDRTQDLPVFTAECGGHAAQPGVVERHHVRAAAARVFVPGGGVGLVQPLRALVAVVEHAHGQLLPGGTRRSAGAKRNRRSSTPIKGASSRPRRSRRDWSREAWRSAWMAAAGRSTTCSSSGCGGA